MATSSEPAKLTIPAAYLEDVRTARVSEIHPDGDMLRANHQEVLESSAGGPADRRMAIGHLSEDIRLLDQLVDATGDTTVTADANVLTDVLQAVVRVLTDRLTDKVQYAPIDMGAVMDLSHRLGWAAQEAVRIEPTLDDSKGA